ncbi:hypothetical protein A2957_01090 [Candidatus Roizmanbacteria bacterium RIFCSPLOWO2_01_FULL_38_11]|uniref:Uncharacterized protein n=1 Tax=Candidatus Roizmanbacteria bacterium RIFCSPLOWO2_01_FULL_38_11 TaxID=1802060 RepID=A0A1F7INS4_9BACT|nr:MAG: hypothetical protein A2957_01090 [Candidatus Roizmanbacteria bacterium RIFCSPLOWO2_01_FULL_38_11]
MSLLIKRGLLAGVVTLVLGLVLQQGIALVFPSIMTEYQNTAIFRPWEDPLMIIYFVYPFIFGLVAAYLWNMLEKEIKGKPLEKALRFAKIYFIIATIPGMFISYTSFQISAMMIVLWTITGFVQALAAGVVFSKVK